MKIQATAVQGEMSAGAGQALSVFDEVIDRTTSQSMKWAIPEKLLAPEEAAAQPLPMWVADMDFRAPQAVIDALHEAVEHGIFGYPGGATDSYVDAVVAWQGRRFGWEVKKEWVVQTSGIITALKTAIQAFTAGVENEVLMDLVRDNEDTAAQADLAHGPQFLLGPDVAGGIVRIAQDEEPGIVADRRLEAGRIEAVAGIGSASGAKARWRPLISTSLWKCA